MTRVSENSSHASIAYSLNKAKRKMEDLQLKGSTLKAMTRPSDDPVSNVEAMSLASQRSDNKQFKRNAEFAIMQLNVTEKSLEQLTDIMTKAKEIAIAQASDLYNPDVRKNVSNEVVQLRNLALSIANKRIGQKYIFGGFSTLKTPFDHSGNYQGDKGHVTLEVSKDFFVQTNLHGEEVFYADEGFASKDVHPLNKFPNMQTSPKNKDKIQNRENSEDNLNVDRELASTETAETNDGFSKRENLFSLLETLSNALENADSNVIQGTLEKFDDAISRLITMRTRVGSISSSVQSSVNTIEAENIDNDERRSKLIDADITELFSDLTKQQEVLKTTYKSSQGLMNTKLLDFLR